MVLLSNLSAHVRACCCEVLETFVLAKNTSTGILLAIESWGKQFAAVVNCKLETCIASRVGVIASAMRASLIKNGENTDLQLLSCYTRRTVTILINIDTLRVVLLLQCQCCYILLYTLINWFSSCRDAWPLPHKDHAAQRAAFLVVDKIRKTFIAHFEHWYWLLSFFYLNLVNRPLNMRWKPQ